jgi:Tol biopolymer transport system component
VFVIAADGRNEVVVAGHPAEDQLLGWAPDGTSLVFLSDRSGTWDLWAVRIAEGKQQGEPKLLKKNFGWDSEVLGIAPDGSLYYKMHNRSGRLYSTEVDLETGKLRVPPTLVTTRYTGPQMFLRWSPDGTNLAYLSSVGSDGPGNNILTIRSSVTQEERFLSPRLRAVSQPSWAPDGRSIIAGGMAATGSGSFRIDTETGTSTLLRKGKVSNPYLCPDGKTLVFAKDGITKRNLDTGDESVVVAAGGHFDLSPDGREVVFQVGEVVKVVSLAGGEPRELFRGSARSYGLKWTMDGRYIIALAYVPVSNGNCEIWRIPAQGGTPLKLEISVPRLYSIALHPDNRRFVYCVGEEYKSELWVLENFLPKTTLAAK